MVDTIKQCNKCGEKDLTRFTRVKKGSDKLHSCCKKCDAQARNMWLKTDNGRKYRRVYSYTVLRYGHSKNKAKAKGIEWSITKAEFNILRDKPCAYCGANIVTTGSGLDRINSDLGYILNNVVPCCYLCNTIKWNYWTYSEMLEIGRLTSILKLRRQSRLPDSGNS